MAWHRVALASCERCVTTNIRLFDRFVSITLPGIATIATIATTATKATTATTTATAATNGTIHSPLRAFDRLASKFWPRSQSFRGTSRMATLRSNP